MCFKNNSSKKTDKSFSETSNKKNCFLKFFIPSIVSISIIVVVAIAISLPKYIGGVFEQTLAFNSYEEMISYYESKYNLEEEEYVFVNTSTTVLGEKDYYLDALDTCYRYDINCVNNDSVNNHYVYSCNFYEFCKLPISFQAIKEQRETNVLEDLPLFYYLDFFPKIHSFDAKNLSWIKASSRISHNFPDYRWMQQGNYECYDLISNNEIIAKIEFDGIPKAHLDEYDKDAHIAASDYFKEIMNSLKELYIFKYGG